MVRLDPDPNNGLDKPSAADAFPVRSVSQSRFVRRLGNGSVSNVEMMTPIALIYMDLADLYVLNTPYLYTDIGGGTPVGRGVPLDNIAAYGVKPSFLSRSVSCTRGLLRHSYAGRSRGV